MKKGWLPPQRQPPLREGGKSATYDTAIILPDHYRRRTRRQTRRVAIRPAAAHVTRAQLPLGGGGSGPGVLHVDEHGALVRRGDDTGDLLADGPGQEAAHLAGLRVGAEHGVVAEHLVHTGVLAAFPDIGLDPHAAVLVDSQAVRRAEPVVHGQGIAIGGLAGQVGLTALPCISAEQEDIPLEGSGGMLTTGFRPADDVAMAVLGARVGAVGGTATTVVGQGEIDITVVRVHRSPFRAVYGRGTDQAGSQAGVDQHIRLVTEAVARIQAVLTVHQRQPFAGAVIVEAGHVEHAGIENGSVGHALLEGLLADELVDELVGGVVPGIAHHRLAFDGRTEYHTLMTEAAQTGALLRHAVRVKGIDLDHPAEAVGFVAVVFQRGRAAAGRIKADKLVLCAFGVRPFVAAILVADTISIMLTRNIASFLPLIDLTGQD